MIRRANMPTVRSKVSPPARSAPAKRRCETGADRHLLSFSNPSLIHERICRGTSASRLIPQLELRQAERQVDPDLALDRERLKRDGSLGAADEHIGTEADADADVGAAADIDPGDGARHGPVRRR